MGESHAGFTVIDLGAVAAGQPSSATGINAAGQTSGTEYSAGTSTATRSTSGGFVPVDTSGLAGAASSTGAGVSGTGQVVGTYYDSIDKNYHGFETVNGRAQDLGFPSTGKYQGANSWGVATNAAGEVLGTAQLRDGSEMAFRATSPGAISIITLPGNSMVGQGAGINSSGTVVGSYLNSLGISRVFVDQDGAGATDLLSHYNVRGFGLNTYGAAIDSKGDVAGYGDFNGQSHAFFASASGTFVDIGVTSGATSSIAIGINNQGQVVGKMDSNGANPQAFVWDQTAGLFDLNNLLSPTDAKIWTLTTATGINDNDQICGQGYINGQLHGFLLTPDAGSSLFGPAVVVPTPPSLVLATMGGVMLGGWLRFKRGRTAGQAAV